MSSVAIKSVSFDADLIYTNDVLSEKYGYLTFNGDDPSRDVAQFELVASNIHPELVHIKCCYNGKYLRTVSQSDLWLSPLADTTEDDESKWCCTLFQLMPVADNPGQYRISHVYLNKKANAAKDPPTGDTTRFLVADSAQNDIFEIIDLPPEARDQNVPMARNPGETTLVP